DEWLSTPVHVRRHLIESCGKRLQPGALSVNKAVRINSLGKLMGDFSGVWALFAPERVPVYIRSGLLDDIGSMLEGLHRAPRLEELRDYLRFAGDAVVEWESTGECRCVRCGDKIIVESYRYNLGLFNRRSCCVYDWCGNYMF